MQALQSRLRGRLVNPFKNTYASPFRLPNKELWLLYWYGTQCPVGLMTWWWSFSRRRDMLGDGLVNALLVLNIFGTIMFYLFGAALIFWAYRFQYLMVASSRRYRCVLGIACSFLPRDLPCWFIELWVLWKHGWFDELQGISFLFTNVSFWCGLISCWLTYTWRLARLCENRFGTGVRRRRRRKRFRDASRTSSVQLPVLEEPLLAREV
eukprot:TRINITY_DN43282_c0_g1_i1.p1 TRINITY_DN43282_c0_g1~~TRINITY_DN43282_c0_g1_i1.p1  ORF type:complete len:230 (+),score=77.67 TRINITY_DN43282_c0_g1_i1:64-690(+)